MNRIRGGGARRRLLRRLWAFATVLPVLWLDACTLTGADPEPESVTAVAEAPVRIPVAGADSIAVPYNRTVYVPAYSHIYDRSTGRTIDLTTTLSIRNTDPDRPITLTWVRYYDNDGALVRSYVGNSVTLAPMASTAYVVEEGDRRGGVGANFLLEWTAAGPVTEPLIETVMISTAGGQGISFTSRGQTLMRQ